MPDGVAWPRLCVVFLFDGFRSMPMFNRIGFDEFAATKFISKNGSGPANMRVWWILSPLMEGSTPAMEGPRILRVIKTHIISGIMSLSPEHGVPPPSSPSRWLMTYESSLWRRPFSSIRWSESCSSPPGDSMTIGLMRDNEDLKILETESNYLRNQPLWLPVLYQDPNTDLEGSCFLPNIWQEK